MGNPKDSDKAKTALTYEEIPNPEDVANRGIDLVPRLANILRRRGAVFKNQTNDSQWVTCEEELGFRLPPDFKLLCNTIGTSGTFGNGNVGLPSPAGLVAEMKAHRENYSRWQDDNVTESGAERVGIYPGHPGHHLQWSVDVQGNAMAFFWIVNHTDPSRWPTVLLDLEAPLRHNGSTLPATVTEIIFRDVTNKIGVHGLAEYDEEEEDEEEEDDDEEGEVITIDGRKVYKFEREGAEPDAKKSKTEEGKEEDGPGSAEDDADFAFLDVEFEPVTSDCTATATVTVK